jgi:N4-(beta-N-acetylglucosaminyl)-L-asparaginase
LCEAKTSQDFYMSSKINRRDFVVAGAAAGVSIAIPSKGEAQAPNVITRSDFKPLVIASGNGNRYRNGGTQTAVEKAFSMITGGSDVLDAVVAGVNIVELDPLDYSVGYGGLPNAEGVVQLDSCVMHGPMMRAGGVCAMEGV